MQIQVHNIEKKGNEYLIHYQAGGALPFVPHDVVLIHGKQYFIGTILRVESEQVLIRINPEYEDQLTGAIGLELAFSPTVSIQGADSIVEKLGYFPPFHYDRVTAANMTKDQITLTIELSPTSVLVPKSPDLEPSAETPVILEASVKDIPRYAVTFTFLETKEHVLTPVETENIILQLDFRYEEADMVVDIDALSGLSGSFLCRGIRAEITELHE
ncbi:immunity 50 family protein [Paenibacillus polymyxa]|uniref:immunity 50 family protein n=1 Tax=Paenibacillus polymyxa TaxID=1406 RepID=UPI002ED3AC4B|nr:immunity 50 family protein [Paenibacillus polymyxa]